MRSSSYHPSIEMNSHLFAVSHDAKHLFTAGHWDYSVKTFSFSKNKYMSSVIRHFGKLISFELPMEYVGFLADNMY